MKSTGVNADASLASTVGTVRCDELPAARNVEGDDTALCTSVPEGVRSTGNSRDGAMDNGINSAARPLKQVGCSTAGDPM